MELQEYQNKSQSTARYPVIGHPVMYPILGLNGEVGEVTEKIKKLFRDDKGVMSEERLEGIKKELGDVLWYMTAICTELNLNLEDVAQANLEKVYTRQANNTLHGDGDNR